MPVPTRLANDAWWLCDHPSDAADCNLAIRPVCTETASPTIIPRALERTLVSRRGCLVKLHLRLGPGLAPFMRPETANDDFEHRPAGPEFCWE